MASVSSQPQFRYTQPPSKVLHLRNLPWECTEEELIELGKPFGKADLNQAIAMISYYASSSEPAQVRGKTVYLQYSNRQEIVNNKTTADIAGNVLLVTIEGQDARLVSIDVLHLVFSAFGFVHKITTFEKTAGFQALVQFSDGETATSARNALDGRIIPRYLLSDNIAPCTLRITYSAHTDLTVKFQSHRSRDYTNPYLPVAPSALDGSSQFNLGLDGKKLEPESNVLLASIENMQYAVTLDVLHMVFSAFGPVQKIAMFDKNGALQALVQYPDVQTAIVAKEALEGHCIYDGGFCKLHLSYSRHTDLSIKLNNDRSRDYTIANPALVFTDIKHGRRQELVSETLTLTILKKFQRIISSNFLSGFRFSFRRRFVFIGVVLNGMASVSSQPQFRYTQPPSKVLHLRNLPWECTEEELIELGKPFGKVVNTKCNVGANRNQAFIEFADLNQAIAMISYYASSSEPAQVRGKTVYLQYSNRQEIVNNKTTADIAGNVLLVTIEGQDARLVSIDVLHLVFSAFGFVHKITTFEKTAGFQALVQFSDAETATSAKNALDGRIIPRYLLSDNIAPCTLRITYSAHTDLSVKFQSHRSRDYTNPYLPVAPSAIDGSSQFSLGLDGKKLEPESNVLLASIENMQYAVTLDVLHMVFSAFGPVQKIAMFDKNGALQALIQYPDVQMAIVAKEALEGHCIYDGGFCKLHLSYSRHTDLSIKLNNDRSRDYTIANPALVNPQPSALGQQPVQTMGQAGHQYNGTQYAAAPGMGQHMMPPQPSAGWGASAVPAVPQSMPVQMTNHNPYVPPASMPQMSHGMMQMPPGQSGIPPPASTMPYFRPDHM
ncbi:hypothetical protein V6N13_077340 [Hibiscus sabdariffa]|uniref:RRM domain-containing protein n=1 Tax=Hibiscus sabdariffa TaxID=183260 RepID=A0ABR2CNL2_9ROSI